MNMLLIILIALAEVLVIIYIQLIKREKENDVVESTKHMQKEKEKEDLICAAGNVIELNICNQRQQYNNWRKLHGIPMKRKDVHKFL